MDVGTVLLGSAAVGALGYGMHKKDKNLDFSTCFIEKLAVPISYYINLYHTNDTLAIDNIKEDHVVINTQHKHLYAFELSGASTIEMPLNNSIIDQLYETASKDLEGYFFQAILKENAYQKQYIFSYSRELIETMAGIFDIKLLRGEEIVDVVFDLFLQNSYYIDDKQIHRQLNISEDITVSTEPVDHTFNKIIKNNIFHNLKTFDVYQGYKAKKSHKQLNYNDLYNIDFSGVIWAYFDFSKVRVSGFIDNIVSKTKFYGGKEPFEQLKSRFESNSMPLILTNYLLISKNLEKSTLNQISEVLNVSFVQKEIDYYSILKKTPLKYRDNQFDLLVELDFLYHKITSVHKHASSDPDIFGKDNKKAHINYGFSCDNSNPHSIFIAPTGSGKSVAKQKATSQMLEIDFETGYAKKLGLEGGFYGVRNFDVGYSDQPTFELLHGNKQNSTGEIHSTLDKFSFNPVNFECDKFGRPHIEDIQFSIDLISMVLESQNSSQFSSQAIGLDVGESSKFKEIVMRLYEKQEFQAYTVRSLKTQTEIYEELLALGYSPNTKLKEIKEEKYGYLKVPLLGDVVKQASIQKTNEQRSANDRESFQNLETKLNDVNSLGYFSKFDNISIQNTAYLYCDLNNIKESSLFVPMFFSIFWKVYIKDRTRALNNKRLREPSPKLLYLIEEASNHFRFKTFETMFEKLIFEARKYNIHMMFVLQNCEDVPYTIFKNINTRIFLFPPKQKEDIIHYIKEELKATEDVVKVMQNTRPYQLAIWYDKGIINMNFDITNLEMAKFTTNPNAKKVEDGR
jgi:hypothetical protein